MTYQALYRKYRPNSFKDIVGQKNIVKVLSNAVIHNKIAHAYLFCGPRGTGKTSMAKIFAKVVNCENLNGVEPCNECVCCKQIENKNFLDIIEIDAASNNGVDEIREIKNKVNLAPNSGKYKVYIIDEVHMLSIGAFNALLKTLEEPPAHIIFILATTEPHKLPITVISRCQRFDFKKFTNEEIVENLNKICKLENLDINDDILNEIATISDGGMRDAVGLLDQLSLYRDKKLEINDLYELSGNLSTSNEIKFLYEYFSNNIDYCLNELKNFERDGKNFGKIADDFLSLLEKILKYKMIPEYNDINDTNFKESYVKIAEFVTKEKLFNIISKLSETIKMIKNVSNPRILLEIVFLMEYNVNNDSNNEIIENSVVVSNKVDSVELKHTDSKENKKKQEKVSKKTSLSKNVSKYKDFSLSSENIEEIKRIRINNCLATANKNLLLEYKNKFSLVLEYMLDENYSNLVMNLQDSDIRVAGSNHMIISIKHKSTADILNEKIYLLDELLSNIFGIDIKSIVVSDEEWLNIRKEYINSKNNNVTYDILNEENYFENSKNVENSDLKGIFGNNIDDIIEVR